MTGAPIKIVEYPGVTIDRALQLAAAATALGFPFSMSGGFEESNGQSVITFQLFLPALVAHALHGTGIIKDAN